MISSGSKSLPPWGVYFVSTVLAEAAVLKALYRQPWSRVFQVSLVMNLASYIILYIFVQYAY